MTIMPGTQECHINKIFPAEIFIRTPAWKPGLSRLCSTPTLPRKDALCRRSVELHVGRMFERRTERLRHVHGRLCSETATSPANPASDGRAQKHTFSLSITPASLFSSMSVQRTQSQVERAQRARAVKLHGKFSWSSEAPSVPIPAPWPKSQETHTGNSFTQQGRNASSEKNIK